ncbi:hypothetical protein [Ruania halotolerans]|uniref:hypothetical protein n=1 Tax=Ruania halotolerans TaxID=2897773 RepID=UPI001E4137D0|nr:hypothetical protein [Ruania halotolerans]UFU05159.1 hypothetical protein LQF10_11825 [Ruania halotolerans]
MSTTTDTTETGATNAVGAYARAVREHLNDLQPEILDELTGGLEADLTDSLADRLPPEELARLTPADMARRFGDPGAYAAEMRDAAGIAPPEPSRSGRRTLAQAMAEGVRSLGERWSGFVSRHGALRVIAPMSRDLRPVWWVLRGWLVYMIASLLFGQGWDATPDGAFWFVLIGLIVLSVQWGRGVIGQGRHSRRWGYAISFLVLLFFVPIVVAVSAEASYRDDAARAAGYSDGYHDGLNSRDTTAPASGVYADGTRVDNLFAYDADGQPLENVRLVDSEGNPIILQPEGGDWETWQDDEAGTPISGVPLAALQDSAALNVFPYSTISPSQLTLEADGSWSWDENEVRQPQWPAPSLFPLPEAGGEPENDSGAVPQTSGDPDGGSQESAPSDQESSPEETATD